MKNQHQNQQGVTLLEILLVIVILSALFMIFVGYMQERTEEMRRSRVTLQMQQILNAGLAYYVNKGFWPGTDTDPTAPKNGLEALKTGQYLPSTFQNNAWAKPYFIANKITSGSTIAAYTNALYVYTDALSYANAQIVAGKLPLSFIADKNNAEKNPPEPSCTMGKIDKSCTYVVTMINIPGQNLNNANAVTFTNIYHANACVPAPLCPAGQSMKPTIMVIPVSISGVNDASSTGDPNVYPIESFTAFAKGTQGDKSGAPDKGGIGIESCQDTNILPCLETAQPPTPVDPSREYWRVCAKVVTEKGTIWEKNNEWGKYINLLAITRCSITKGKAEYGGSDFTVWK